MLFWFGVFPLQLIEKDPSKAISMFWAAINAGDRVDSALKDMAVAMKQLDRSDEAIEAIKSFRHLCPDDSQESLDNILIELYKVNHCILKRRNSNNNKNTKSVQLARLFHLLLWNSSHWTPIYHSRELFVYYVTFLRHIYILLSWSGQSSQFYQLKFLSLVGNMIAEMS